MERADFEALLEKIDEAGAGQIGEILQAAIDRYRELFPDYDITYLALPRDGTRQATIDAVMAYLEEEEPGTR